MTSRGTVLVLWNQVEEDIYERWREEGPLTLAWNPDLEVPDVGTTTLFPATPVDFGDATCEPRWMAPEIGQHSDEVLAELGRTAEEIALLRERGVVA